jgi:Vitamin B6 photo-protection and homoeostasis
MQPIFFIFYFLIYYLFAPLNFLYTLSSYKLSPLTLPSCPSLFALHSPLTHITPNHIHQKKKTLLLLSLYNLQDGSDNAVTVVRETELNTLSSLFRSIFLPEGYPSSVSKDYLSYQIWDTLQVSTYLTNCLYIYFKFLLLFLGCF